MSRLIAVVFFVILVSASAISQAKYSWQWHDTACDQKMTFCWYGPFKDNSDEVNAWGNQWVSQGHAEKPLEWNSEVRCIKARHICIIARNQKVWAGTTLTNIDLYSVTEWSDYQIRADEEEGRTASSCEQDTLLINRADASVSMLSNPGPAAGSSSCKALMKPKTVIYTLAQ